MKSQITFLTAKEFESREQLRDAIATLATAWENEARSLLIVRSMLQNEQGWTLQRCAADLRLAAGIPNPDALRAAEENIKVTDKCWHRTGPVTFCGRIKEHTIHHIQPDTFRFHPFQATPDQEQRRRFVTEGVETAALRPTTRAGWALLGREALNSRAFSLITAADIVAIEAEARSGYHKNDECHRYMGHSVSPVPVSRTDAE